MKAKRITLAIVLVLICVLLTACSTPEGTYKQAQTLLSQGKYTEAAEKFESLGSYEDAAILTMYCKACALCEAGNFEAGIAGFESLGNYKDCSLRITYYTARSWDDNSVGTTEFEWMNRAKSIYNENPLYLDSAERITALDARIESAKKTLYDDAVAAAEQGQYSTAIATFQRLGNYKDSAKRATYYGIRMDEEALAGTTNETACDAVAARYTNMGNYLDCADRAAAVTAQAAAIRDDKYDAAVAMLNDGRYKEAYNIFFALNNYKDSEKQAEVARQQYQMAELMKAAVGSYVIFGAYEQDNNTSNGKEDIEWLVLAKEKNRLLVISKYALDTKPYNEKHTYVTWETCTLRKWLNNDFLNAAFNSTEKAMIPTVTVSADKNPKYSRNPGNTTQDKVFLLSIPEANKYFTSNSARQCEPTAYAKKQGAYTNNGGFCWWWLRSPGYGQDLAAYVNADGGVIVYGYYVIDDCGAVRPALWVDLESGVF